MPARLHGLFSTGKGFIRKQRSRLFAALAVGKSARCLPTIFTTSAPTSVRISRMAWDCTGMGLAYVLSFVLGGWLYRWLAEHRYTDLPAAQVSDFICWAAVFGVMLGGRLGWILFYGLRQSHVGDPWYWPIEVWKGGMASHGGIIGLVLFTLYWSKRHHVSWTSIGDSLVVVAPVGLFLVRVANFINGELFGKPATVPWAVQFPKELIESAFAESLGARARRPGAFPRSPRQRRLGRPGGRQRFRSTRN